MPVVGVRPLPAAITLAAAVYALYFFDKVQPKLAARRLGPGDVLLSLPLALPLLLLGQPLAAMPSALLLSAALAAAYRGDVGWANALGTGFVASLSIVWGYINNAYTPAPQALWTTYALAEALYVEYKAPFREVGKWIPLTAWALGVIAVAPFVPSPLYAIPLAEPTLRYISPGPKLSSPREMTALGRRLAKRTAVFFALLATATALFVLGVGF